LPEPSREPPWRMVMTYVGGGKMRTRKSDMRLPDVPRQKAQPPHPRSRFAACEGGPTNRNVEPLGYLHAFASFVVLTSLSIGCQGETQAGGAPADGSPVADSDSRGAFDGGRSEAESGASVEAGGGNDAPSCSPSTNTICTLIGGVYNCDCDVGTVPACPSSASMGVSCDYPPPPHDCFGCTPGIGSFTCACVAGGASDGGGSGWVCLDSSFVCQ
jgi:hypothetical protein